MYYITKELYDKKTALISGLILAVFPLHILMSKMAMADILTNLIFLLLFYMMLVFHKTGQKKYLYLGAVIFGLGINNVENVVLFTPLFMIYAVLNPDIIKKLQFRSVTAAIIIAALVALPTLGSFIIFKFLGFPTPILHYTNTAGFGSGILENFSFYITGFVNDNTIFFALSSLMALIYFLYYRDRKSGFLLAWFVLIFCFFSLASGISFTRYLLLVLIPVSILIGRMVVEVFENNRILIVYILLGLFIISINHTISQSFPDWKGWDEVGSYIKTNTQPDDLIFTDQGWIINFYADRYATNYINYNELENPPENLKFIVIKADEFQKEKTRQYAEYIDKNFQLTKTIKDFKIYSVSELKRSKAFRPKPFFADIYLKMWSECNYSFQCLKEKISVQYGGSAPISSDKNFYTQ